MLKIAFHTNQMSERGTEVALYDYAVNNIDLLGNKSIVIFDKNSKANNSLILSKFAERFELFGYNSTSEIDPIVSKENCDLLYAIKSGERDGLYSAVVPTMVHGVFPVSPREVHESAYAFVSDWLSKYCSDGRVPSVPHIVSIAARGGDLRRELAIPPDGVVFGCYGGRDSFDIPFVKRLVIPAILEVRRDAFFIFMNIDRFVEHERVKFLAGSGDGQRKAAFVRTCDAMLHARFLGESFGLACGEFSLANKPVITFALSPQRAHIEIMGEAAHLYRDHAQLYNILLDFKKSDQHKTAFEKYSKDFSPAQVMQQFKENLIDASLAGDQSSAAQRLGNIAWLDFRFKARRNLSKFVTKRALRKSRSAERATLQSSGSAFEVL